MNELIFYLLRKYHGSWDKVYDAICSKEKLDFDLVKELTLKYCPLMTWITKDEYPNKLKDIYMPPFALFYLGNLNLIETEVLGILGKIDSKHLLEFKEIVKNYTICLEEKDLTEEFYNWCVLENISLIIISTSTLEEMKFQFYPKSLFISEYFAKDWVACDDQNNERILYAFSDKILVNTINQSKLNNLTLNYENIKKPIFSLEKNKNKEAFKIIFKDKEIHFIKNYTQIV